MMQSFLIHGRLDGLNEYTSACRSKSYAGAAMKKRNQELVARAIRNARLAPMDTPVRVRFIWYDKENRNHRHRDKDNIAFAKKFVLDALVDAGIISDDDWDSVDSFQDFFEVADSDAVEVEILEVRRHV